MFYSRGERAWGSYALFWNHRSFPRVRVREWARRAAMSHDSSMTSARRGTAVNRRDFMRVAGASTIGVAVGDMIAPATAASDNASGRVTEFIRKVKAARLFDLSPVWDENSPIASVNPSYSMKLNRTHAQSDP